MAKREEVFNVVLCEILNGLGGKLNAEVNEKGNIPDVSGFWYGVGVVIECKYAKDQSHIKEVADQIATRLLQGYGPVGVEVLYPSDLSTTELNPSDALNSSTLTVRLRLAGGQTSEYQEVDGVKGLAKLLDLARLILVKDDEVDQSVKDLARIVDQLAIAFSRQPGHDLEVVELVTANDPTGAGSTISKNEIEAAHRVGALALCTALLMQHSLADFDKNVPKVPDEAGDRRSDLVRSWKKITSHNYRAIFDIALKIVETLGDSEESLELGLGTAVEVTRSIVKRKILGRHDLIGRIYHQLLSQQKYLATYYTSIPAGTLLASLSLAPSLWAKNEFNFDNREINFKVGDPAQGTGTLLAASLTAIRQNHSNERLQKGLPVESTQLCQKLIEDNIYGFDVLAYAVQIAATTLLLSAPGTVVNNSKLYQLPFGGDSGLLGSLEFLDKTSHQGILFGAVGTHIGVDSNIQRSDSEDSLSPKQRDTINLPDDLSLVIMNPPFTRSTGGSRLLGSLDSIDLPVARKRLDTLAKTLNEGSLTAGLGALFIPLAHRMLKPGGRLSVILPKTLLTGSHWSRTRELLSKFYHVEIVVSSHESDNWNFSDSTELSEVMFVARKLNDNESLDGKLTKWVQLTRNPRNALDANGVATAILDVPLDVEESEIKLSSSTQSKFGVVFLRAAPQNGEPWRHAQFTRSALESIGLAISENRGIQLPRTTKLTKIKLCPLLDLGVAGPDRRDLMDGFKKTESVTAYPVLSGNDSTEVGTLMGSPNGFLEPLTRPLPKRRLKDPEKLWQGAGRLLVAERLWLPTHRSIAITTPQDILSTVHYSIHLTSNDEDDYKVLGVWLTSTLGVLSWIYLASETRGPWVSVKKHQLKDLNVLDPSLLNRKQKSEFGEIFEAICYKQLLPISKIERDPVRQFCDEGISKILGISEDGLRATRNLLGTEPKLYDGDLGLPDTIEVQQIEEAVRLFKLGKN